MSAPSDPRAASETQGKPRVRLVAKALPSRFVALAKPGPSAAEVVKLFGGVVFDGNPGWTTRPSEKNRNPTRS